MSNYKPRIESNNLDLTSILSTINELPDAGGETQMSVAWVMQYTEVWLVCFNEGDTWGDFLSSIFNEKHFYDGTITHYYTQDFYGTDYIVYESMATFYVSLDGTSANRVTMTDAIIPNNVYRVYDDS